MLGTLHDLDFLDIDFVASGTTRAPFIDLGRTTRARSILTDYEMRLNSLVRWAHSDLHPTHVGL